MSPGHTWVIPWPYRMSKDMQVMCDLPVLGCFINKKKEPFPPFSAQLWLTIRSTWSALQCFSVKT